MFEPLPLGFPTGGGTTANPSPKSGKVCFLLIFGRFFHLPNGASKFTSKKHRKMSENRRFCSPKTLPKCVQNRIPKKHAIFARFLHERLSAANVPTLIPYWFLQCFVLVGHISSNRFLHTFWFQNACQKPFRNEVRTLEKSMQKTYWFLTSIF